MKPDRPRLLSFSLGRALRRMLAVAGIWWGMTAPVRAQLPGEEQEPKGYVANYIIIIFAVAFALLLMCRSGKRTTSFRVEE